MAASAECLSSQLNTKLKDESVPFQNRLDLAKTVFISTSIPILQKEDFILDYLINSFNNTNDAVGKLEILKTIHSCLCSNRMKCFTGLIRPSIVKDLLQMLHSINDNEEIIDYKRNIIIEVLNTRYFQRLFACDVAGLCKLFGSLLSDANESSRNQCLEAIRLFLLINKMTLLKEEIRINFLQEAFVPMCTALTLIGDDACFTLRDKIVQCLIQVVLFESTFTNVLLNPPLSDRDKNDVSNKMLLAVCKIKALPSECNVHVVSSCYTLLLRAFVSKLVNPSEEDYKIIFKLFEVFSKQMGLTVDKVESISIGPIRGWDTENTFYVICEMMKVLDDAKIPLKIEFDGYTLETWMISLVIGMTSINFTTLTPALLNMNEAAFRLNPLIIEPCINIIVRMMLCPKSKEVHRAYTNMMLAAINGTEKVKRLQKFISLILGNIRLTLMNNCPDSLTVNDIIPVEVGDAFSEAVETFSNAQALSTMRALLFHLEADSLSHVEASSVDNPVLVNTEIIVELLTKLIYGVKFADHSVPDIVKAKFKCQLEDLRNLLAKFSETSHISQSSHNDRLLKCFLQLCHTYGAIQLLFDEYEGSPMKPLIDIDLNPTNLSYVHPYINPNQWRRIFKKVVAHEGCLAKPDLLRLLLQKIAAVSQVEVGSEGPGSQAARYILELAELEWLWSHIVVLAPLFQAMELDNLIKSLVKSCKNDQSRWKKVINNNFLEDRRLVLATGLHLLHKAGRIISHSSNMRSVTSEIMSHLVIHNLLEYELSQLITEDLELSQEIEEAIIQMSSIVNNKLSDKNSNIEPKNIPHESYFEILNILPLHHFTLLTQSCIVLSLVSLLIDLPPEIRIDIRLLDTLYNILDGPQSHSHKLLGRIDPGLLIKFLAKRAESYPSNKELMFILCHVALKDRDTAKQLMKCASKPKKDTLWITTMVIKALKKVKKIDSNSDNEDDDDSDKKMSPRKKPLNKKECINRLTELAVPILLNENPSSQLLPDYAVILKHELSNKSLGQLNNLLTKLEEYSQIAIADYTVGGGGLVEVMMCYRNELGNSFPKFLVDFAWNHLLKETDTEPIESVAGLVFSSANTEEFSDIIKQLLSRTVSEVKNVTEGQQSPGLETVFSLWTYLVQQSSLPSDKCRIRKECLVSMVTPVTELISSWSTQEASCLQSVPLLLGFYSNLIPQLGVELKPVIIDTILLSLSAVPLNDTDQDILIQRLNLVIDNLFALYLFRTSLVIDRLPAIMQRYRNCLLALAPLAEPSQQNIDPIMSVAGKLERIATTMVKRAKDFTRIAPYIIADVIGIFGKFPIHADIKNLYTNIIISFLPVCDSHAITYLKATLPLASKELFKNIYDNYNKHHRYVGKI
ncbi:hypothetical protein O3M35_005297 [Rhynocoris fuscipes]|uniref:Nucleolar 27S pre-rRNA processing Urb2/Npa2 C-terminal domain-containing protein n=1 Tax=Rhynocoris fuscipes TaxID=488301 RepID=A0AAW1DJM0_9HEMI